MPGIEINVSGPNDLVLEDSFSITFRCGFNSKVFSVIADVIITSPFRVFPPFVLTRCLRVPGLFPFRIIVISPLLNSNIFPRFVLTIISLRQKKPSLSNFLPTLYIAAISAIVLNPVLWFSMQIPPYL